MTGTATPTIPVVTQTPQMTATRSASSTATRTSTGTPSQTATRSRTATDTPTRTTSATPTPTATPWPASGYALAGQVFHYGDGAPVPDVSIMIAGVAGNRASVTDDSGDFAFSAVAAGDWQLVPSKQGDMRSAVARSTPHASCRR